MTNRLFPYQGLAACCLLLAAAFAPSATWATDSNGSESPADGAAAISAAASAETSGTTVTPLPAPDKASASCKNSDRSQALDHGKASWYGPRFHGRTTANGERYDMHQLTAAHKSLPFGTLVKVCHLLSGRSVVVRINDRGPYIKGRVIDLSKAAAHKIGIRHRGVGRVVVLPVS